MTVPSATNKSGPYSGNGVTTVFAYGFRILDATHIQVVTTTGDIDTIVSASAYSVSGVGDTGGGNVTFTTAPATGTTVNLIRNAPFTQGVDLENQGAYYAETIEEAFDLAAMRDQQLQEQVNRAVRIPVGADASTLDDLIEDIIRLGVSGDEIDTVAGISGNVTTVAGISGNVTTVAGISADVTSVAGVAASVPTVAAIDTDVTTVAGIAANVTTVAGVSADVTTVAGVSADVTTVAGLTAEIAALPGQVTSAQTAASDAEAAIVDFETRYLGAKASAPTLDNEGNALIVGATYWDTGSNQMFTWDGAEWAPTFLTGNTVRSLVTATSGQTVFTTPTYRPGLNTLSVFVNGVKVLLTTDYAETTQNSITFTAGLTAGDEVELIAVQSLAVYDLAGKNYVSRAAFIADTAYLPADGTVVTAGGLQYVRSEGAIALPGLPGWLPFGQWSIAHFAAFPKSDPMQTVDAINAAEMTAQTYRQDLIYPSGRYWCGKTVIRRNGVNRRGVGALSNWRPNPSTIGASQPAEMYTIESGAELVFVGTPSKDFTLDFCSDMAHEGGAVENPSRPFSNANDEFLSPTNFTNADASGTTPATLRAFSVCVYEEAGADDEAAMRGSTENIRIVTSCPGEGETYGAGGYADPVDGDGNLRPWSRWDVGLFCESPWGVTRDRMQVVGYYDIKGVVETGMKPSSETQFRGYAEKNINRQCIVQSGWALRLADHFTVLAATADTVTVKWSPSHRFAPDGGTIRVQAGFFSSVVQGTYSGLSFNAGDQELTLTGVVGIPSAAAGQKVILAGGAGFAKTAFYDCEIYDFSHNSRLDQAAPEIGLPYSANLEITGEFVRAVTFYGGLIHPTGPMVAHVLGGSDLEFFSCWLEPRGYRTEVGGATLSGGAAFVMKDGRISVYGRTFHPGINLAPLANVLTGGRMGEFGNADFFSPSAYWQPREREGKETSNFDDWGLRGQEIDLRTRDGSGTLRRILRGLPTGEARLGHADNFLEVPVSGDVKIQSGLDFTGTHDIRNDSGELDNPSTAHGRGLRYDSASRVLRLGRTNGEALELSRDNSGRFISFFRNAVRVGFISVFVGFVRYYVTDTHYLYQSGTTAGRPAGAPTGFRYFDTTLGIPVYWTGTNWVDATGATV